MTFQVLQRRLIALINFRIRNGEFTERGLARILEISQPQMHNVLKGQRKLHCELADVMLRKLGVTVLDLIDNSEIYNHKSISGAEAACTLRQPLEVVRLLETISPETVRRPERKPPLSELQIVPVRRRAV